MPDPTAEIRPLHPALLLAVLLLTAVAAPISLNKVSPIAPALMQAFGIGESQVGLLMSAPPVTGIALALPGGMLVRRFGPWACMLAALAVLAAGSAAGALAGSFAVLLLTRVIEGAGVALVAVAGPSIIGESVSEKSRGVAMGLFAAYMGVGQVIILAAAPRILPLAGWRGAWWFSALYAAAFIIVWLILMAKARVFRRYRSKAPGEGRAPGSSVFKSGSLWGLAASMGLYVASYVSIQMFLPSYLAAARSMSLADASGLTSVCCFTGTLFSLVAGRLSDVLKSRRALGGLCLIAGAALFALIPCTPAGLLLPLAIVLGMVPTVLPVCVFTAASDLFPDPEKGGIAMGLVSMGQNIGFTAGPILFGAIAQGLGWDMAFFAMIPVAAAGGALMLANRRVK